MIQVVRNLCTLRPYAHRRDYIMERLDRANVPHRCLKFGDKMNIVTGHKKPTPLNLHSKIIGAHYDTVHRTPGANDNAASVAILLDLAPKIWEHTTVVFFDTEEPIHPIHGSYMFGKLIRSLGYQPDPFIVLDVCGIGDVIYESCLSKRPTFKQVPVTRETLHSDNLHLASAGIESTLLSVLPADEIHVKNPKTWGTMHSELDIPDLIWPETLNMVRDKCLEILSDG